MVKIFCLFYKIYFKNISGFILLKRISGYFDVHTANDAVIHVSASNKNLKPLKRHISSHMQPMDRDMLEKDNLLKSII